MKTFLIASVTALLLGSASFASAHTFDISHQIGNRTSAQTVRMSNVMPTAMNLDACAGYGYAFGGDFCETATGGPVGGIN